MTSNSTHTGRNLIAVLSADLIGEMVIKGKFAGLSTQFLFYCPEVLINVIFCPRNAQQLTKKLTRAIDEKIFQWSFCSKRVDD